MKQSPKRFFLINANIITLDPVVPHASWLAIENEKFIKIGNSHDWKDLKNKNTTIVDCAGKTVLPGFIDAHIHLVSYAKSLVELNLRPSNKVLSIESIRSCVRHCAEKTTAGEWIRGRGYNEFYLCEKRHPNRWDLDDATREHPVVLTHRTGHAHCLNSLALKLVGISVDTEDPPGGMIERDLTTGEPTGVLYEMGDLLSDRIPRSSLDEIEGGMRLADRQLVSAGITSVQDASSSNDAGKWELLESWKKSEILQPRVGMMLGYDGLRKIGFGELSTILDENQLRTTGVKIILDYTTGELHPSQAELNEKVLEVHRAGIQVAIHAIEEQAIEAACMAIRYALDKAPRADHRHRIEHCSVCPPSLAAQIACLGITVVTQPPFIYYNGERYLAKVPEDQLQNLYPIRTLLLHGIDVAGSSDCPIVPHNPLIGIYAAASRLSEHGRIVGEGQGINAMDALRMYTQHAAKASFDENIKGSITPGKLADLVVLNGDPIHLPWNEFKNLQVDMTIIGGEVVWVRGSQEIMPF
jgi:predicted amidohydrolase YtcJ